MTDRRDHPSLDPADRIELERLANEFLGPWPSVEKFERFARAMGTLAIEENFPKAASIEWLAGKGCGFPRSNVEPALVSAAMAIDPTLNEVEALAILREFWGRP
jgi:hypothetical protein